MTPQVISTEHGYGSVHYRVSKKVLPCDKQSNSKLSFYCLNFSDCKYIFMNLNSDTSTTQSDKNCWRYTNLKIKSHFYERQNLGNFELSFRKNAGSANRYLSALGHSISILSYFQVEEGSGDHLASTLMLQCRISIGKMKN